MRAWLLIFCLLFSACRPTPAETSPGGSDGLKPEPVQSLYFIFKGDGACPPRELTTRLGSFRVYATPYTEISSRAPGRISDLRLPADIARGGDDTARFVNGARLISFDPVHKTLLLSVTRDRLVRLSIDGGIRKAAEIQISPEAERSVLWWDTSETDIKRVASEIEQAVLSSRAAAERAHRELIGISKSSAGITQLEEDSETAVFVRHAGASERSQYARTYLRGNYVSEGAAGDPIESVRQVEWVSVSHATAASKCNGSRAIESAARTVNIGTNERPLFVDIIGSPDAAAKILIFFNGGPSNWNRRPQDTQYIGPLLSDRNLAVVEVAYSGSSGSGLATFARLRTEGPAKAIEQDALAVANWLRNKQAPVVIVGASFGSAAATSLAAILGANDHRCTKLALVVPLVIHTDATYSKIGNDPTYQRAFEAAMLGPDLTKAWQQYNDLSKTSLGAANRPATTFLIADRDELISREDVLLSVRRGRDELVQLTGSHSTAGGDPKIPAALKADLESCVR